MNTQETATKNIYKKYCPNVFVAKCQEQHEKGETIILTTKYGQEHENEVHNYLGKTADGFFLYSITRCDGFNTQERAKRKAEKLNGYSSNAEKRSQEAYNTRATRHELDFLSLGEPIKVGHHSERRHRRLFEKYDNKMRKSISESEKAEDYRRRSEYWEAKASKINLSLPESLDFFEFKLEESKKAHKFLKDNPQKRPHGMSLQYANKEVKELTSKVETAINLWGDSEYIEQLNKEKIEEAKAKVLKGKKGDRINAIIDELGGFFFFGTDKTEFLNKYNKLKEAGKVEEGEKVIHIKHGLYIPVKHKEEFLKVL